MNGIYQFQLGDRGRVVIPAELRQAHNWSEGTTLVAFETENGVVLSTREELEVLVRSQHSGTNVVESLLADRRAAAAIEDES